MKTIEERCDYYTTKFEITHADELCKYPIEIARESYIAGAIDEREELTRWNDPFSKDVPNGNVIVKYIAVDNPATSYYTIGLRHLSGRWDCENELATAQPRFEIVGWREIHE